MTEMSSPRATANPPADGCPRRGQRGADPRPPAAGPRPGRLCLCGGRVPPTFAQHVPWGRQVRVSHGDTRSPRTAVPDPAVTGGRGLHPCPRLCYEPVKSPRTERVWSSRQMFPGHHRTSGTKPVGLICHPDRRHSGTILGDYGRHGGRHLGVEPLGPGPLFFAKGQLCVSLGGRGTHHDHHVPPAALVELLHHGREVPKAILVKSEVPLGVHVVQVIPLDVLQPQHRTSCGLLGTVRPPPPGPRPAPALTRGKWALVMFSTTWRVMAVDE